MLAGLKWWLLGIPRDDAEEDDQEDDDVDDEDILEIPMEMEEKVANGKVSHLMEDHGLIDNRFQFSRTLHPRINYGGPIRVGTQIRFRLSRPKAGVFFST